MSENPQLPPLAIRFDIVPIGNAGIVRLSFDHGLMSTTVGVPVTDILKFGGEVKRMCHEADGAWKDQQRSGLVVPAKTLLIPGQN